MEGRVLYWFRELSRIPRVSGNEQRVSDWLVAQAKAMGLVAEQDEALNVIIRKGEGNPVILQGHMDMVGEKEADSPHDFPPIPSAWGKGRHAVCGPHHPGGGQRGCSGPGPQPAGGR